MTYMVIVIVMMIVMIGVRMVMMIVMIGVRMIVVVRMVMMIG